jgi:hypothetical protein
MSFLKRTVDLSKTLRPYDSTGDGYYDMLITSGASKTIQIPVNKKFDDIGIYEVDDEMLFEVIDLASLLDQSGSGVQPPPPFGGVTGGTFGTGGSNSGGTVVVNGGTVLYCGDISMLTYGVPVCSTTDPGYGPCGPHNALQMYGAGGTPGPLVYYPALDPQGNNPQPSVTFQHDQTLCIAVVDPPPPQPPVPPQDIYYIETNDVDDEPCDWILGPYPAGTTATDVWNAYKATALVNAQAHCVANGWQWVNTVANSINPSAVPFGYNFDPYNGMVGTTSSTCANWSNSTPGNVIGVQLKDSQSEYCCDDDSGNSTNDVDAGGNTYIENDTGTNPSFTLSGAFVAPTFNSYNGNIFGNQSPAPYTTVSPLPMYYDKAQMTGPSAGLMCKNMATVDYYNCRNNWSNGATVLDPSSIVYQTGNNPPLDNTSSTKCDGSTCNQYCPCTQSTMNIKQHSSWNPAPIEIRTSDGNLKNYADMATISPTAPGFPCIHPKIMWRIEYCFQCVDTY